MSQFQMLSHCGFGCFRVAGANQAIDLAMKLHRLFQISRPLDSRPPPFVHDR